MSSPGTFGTFYAGGKVVLATGGSPDEAFALIEEEKVTITALVPPLAMIWLDAASSRNADLSSLGVIQVGGAKFSAEGCKTYTPYIWMYVTASIRYGGRISELYQIRRSGRNYYSYKGRPMSAHDEVRVVDENDNDVKPGEVGSLLTRGIYNSWLL